MRTLFPLLLIAVSSFNAHAVGQGGDGSKPTGEPSELRVKLTPLEARKRVNLGTVLTGQVYTVSLRVENGTGGRFTPIGSRASCSCVLAKLPENGIDAGQDARFEIRVKSPPKSQSIKQYIDIVSKDGESSRIYTLMIEGTAKTAVDISSKRVKLDKIAGETS